MISANDNKKWVVFETDESIGYRKVAGIFKSEPNAISFYAIQKTIRPANRFEIVKLDRASEMYRKIER